MDVEAFGPNHHDPGLKQGGARTGAEARCEA